MENAKVGFELLLDKRPLHLDCELFAVTRGRDMDLGNRIGRMWHGVERRKYLFGIRAELTEDGLTDRFVWNRRGLIEKLQQFGAILARQQIEPQGERLPDLRPGCPQMLEKKTQTHFGWDSCFSWTKPRENIKSRNSRDNLTKTSRSQKRVANIEGQLLITCVNH